MSIETRLRSLCEATQFRGMSNILFSILPACSSNGEIFSEWRKKVAVWWSRRSSLSIFTLSSIHIWIRNGHKCLVLPLVVTVVIRNRSIYRTVYFFFFFSPIHRQIDNGKMFRKQFKQMSRYYADRTRWFRSTIYFVPIEMRSFAHLFDVRVWCVRLPIFLHLSLSHHHRRWDGSVQFFLLLLLLVIRL